MAERAEESAAETRYDRIAEGYARCWGPVIRPAAEALLELAEPAVGAGATHLLDIGTGTGTLALAAIERWSHVSVVGIDASAGMLELARRNADERLPAKARGQFETRVAAADELPFSDGSFDLVLSSFVLQLVPSRAAALREARRVLRPCGTFAWVTWLVGGVRYAGDRIADAVLDEAGFDPPEADTRSGDVASSGAAAQSMRRAGFREVRTRPETLEHPWDPGGYLAFLTEFDEETLFSELEPRERHRIERKLRTRLAALPPEDLVLRLPVVYVSGRVPG